MQSKELITNIKKYIDTRDEAVLDLAKAEKGMLFEETIDDLKVSSKYKIGDIVELLGYYEAGDGAGHKRRIDNADDGSGVQLNNRLWANIVHNGEVNVSWFGVWS